MPATIPSSVRESWGEEATTDFVRWFDQTIREEAVPRDEYQQILSRIDSVEHDVEDLKEDVAEVKQDLRDLRREMNERFDQMYDRLLVMTRWTVGVIALFGTAVTILLAIAQLTP